MTRFKSDVLNLYRSHVESLSRLPEFQKKESAAEDKAAEEPVADAAPETEAALQEPAAEQQPAAESTPAQEDPAEETAAEETPAEESSEDFWAKDESQLKLDPPPADARPDEPDYDAFQGVKFSE